MATTLGEKENDDWWAKRNEAAAKNDEINAQFGPLSVLENKLQQVQCTKTYGQELDRLEQMLSAYRQAESELEADIQILEASYDALPKEFQNALKTRRISDLQTAVDSRKGQELGDNLAALREEYNSCETFTGEEKSESEITEDIKEEASGSEPILSETGEEAQGIRRNTETGETYYTDPPPSDETEPETDTADNLVNDDAGTAIGLEDFPGEDAFGVGLENNPNDPTLPLDQQGGSSRSQGPSGKSPTVRPNPLSKYASYTYNIGLYMLTPDALNSFETNDRNNLTELLNNGQGFVILQSGGINKNVNRAAGFELDFYIDNLRIQTKMPVRNGGPITVNKMQFQVFEPYGFSFLANLKKASDQIAKLSKLPNVVGQGNPSRNMFVIGLQFRGWDIYGNDITTLDDEIGTFSQYWPIIINKLSFKIDGSMVVYDIQAVSTPVSNALSLKNARLDTNFTITAETVEEALKKITEELNKNIKDQKLEDGGPINKYSIEVINAQGAEDFYLQFAKAKIALPFNKGKDKQPTGDVDKNPKPTEARASKEKPEPSKRVLSGFGGSSIIELVERVVVQSEFMTKALDKVYVSDFEPNQNQKDFPSYDGGKREFLWYNISAKTQCLGYNKKINDYVWDIKYVISPYRVPMLLSTATAAKDKYYGPVKRYDYWWTGKNTEVLRYEQTNNNGFFITVVKPDEDEEDVSKTGKDASVPVKVGQPAGGNQQGVQNPASQPAAEVVTSLYDPKSFSNAKISILGDPDFLVSDQISQKGLEVYNQFFASKAPGGRDNTQVSVTGGQIFVELDFHEARDYITETTGLMEINDQITFWQMPEYAKKLVKGVSFLVKGITHSFGGGSFTSELDCTINVSSFPPEDTGKAGAAAGNDAGREKPSETKKNSPSPKSSSTANNSGLKTEPKPTPKSNTPSQSAGTKTGQNRQDPDASTTTFGSDIDVGTREIGTPGA